MTALYKSFICLFLSGHNSISGFFLVTLQTGLTISPKGRCDFFCHDSNDFSSLWAECQSQDLIINYFLQCEERFLWSWLRFLAKFSQAEGELEYEQGLSALLWGQMGDHDLHPPGWLPLRKQSQERCYHHLTHTGF